MVLSLIAVVIVAGNLLVDRSGDPDGSEAAEPPAGVVSSESSTLVLVNLETRARELRVEGEARAAGIEGDRFAEITARRLEAARRREDTAAPPAMKLQREFGDLPGSVTPATLDAIADCESGGDPEVVSSNGLYHGKYQFSPDTWQSVGGKGLPSRAPEVEQDYRAALLYERSGPGQWPVCGQ